MGLAWIRGGNDRELAATQYRGRESATARKNRKEAEATPAKTALAAARAGQAWEDADRRRERRGR